MPTTISRLNTDPAQSTDAKNGYHKLMTYLVLLITGFVFVYMGILYSILRTMTPETNPSHSTKPMPESQGYHHETARLILVLTAIILIMLVVFSLFWYVRLKQASRSLLDADAEAVGSGSVGQAGYDDGDDDFEEAEEDEGVQEEAREDAVRKEAILKKVADKEAAERNYAKREAMESDYLMEGFDSTSRSV
ncbi:hypothetical protein FKW77_010066 [Venturia effusa]|uniref:Uncharacterized protein n=1 Tax=Venturia effusa TaxID=50376 RepID=A0A517L898_9PEZI|nr:hypothetical protein FKW77_010066 [Venturia effusa]